MAVLCYRCKENPYVDNGDGYGGLCPSCADWAYGQECSNCKAGTLEWNESDNTLACTSECGTIFHSEVQVLTPANQLLCFPSFLFRPEGANYVRFIDLTTLEELVYWDCQEWADDPELVMGAIMGCLQNGAEL